MDMVSVLTLSCNLSFPNGTIKSESNLNVYCMKIICFIFYFSKEAVSVKSTLEIKYETNK